MTYATNQRKHNLTQDSFPESHSEPYSHIQTMSTAPITVLFVPGAWHSASHFGTVAKIVEKDGISTELVELPSVGPSKHLTNFDEDVQAIRQHVASTISKGHKVAIVAHSYGGIPSCQALQEFVKTDANNIAHLYFCASFIIPEDASLISAFGGQDLPWFRVSADRLEVNPDTPEAIFYNDLADETAKELVKQLKPQSYQVMHSPLTYAAWKHVPCTYLYCKQDQAIPLEIQKMMVEGTAAGFPVKTDMIDTGHSPFISKPAEVAESILKAIRN